MDYLCTHCTTKLLNRPAKKNIENNLFFCNKECWNAYNKHLRTIPNFKCGTCNKPIYKKPSVIKKSESGLVFCSVSCSTTYQNINLRTGKDHPKFNTSKNNYRAICFAYHDKSCIICGESNIVTVHHYDNNHSNNDPSNLIPICSNHHLYVHSKKFNHLVQGKIDAYRNDFIEQLVDSIEDVIILEENEN